MWTRLAAVAAVSACMGGAPAGAAPGAGPACGTVIVPTGLGVGFPTQINSLNPLLTSSTYAHEVIEQIYRPLVWIDRHGQLDPERGLATAVETPDDGQSFLVTLHDWRWSDGVPVTADDVVFTIDLIRRMGQGYVWYGTGGMPTLVASARAVSPHQVEFRMVRKVNPRWFTSLGLGNLLFPLPRHVFAGLSPVELRRRQNDASLFAVSDSAFLLKEFAIGRHVVFVPNPSYGGHHPQVQRLIITFPTGNSALEQLRSGTLDMASIPYLLSRFAGSLPGFRVVTPPTLNFNYGQGFFNFVSKRAPFIADDAVRRAITRGVNQDEIISLVFHGQSTIDHGPVPPPMRDLLSDKAREGYPELSYDPAAARALLAGDGWTPGADGILMKNGQRLAFEIATSSESPPGVITAQVIQRNLRAIGMEVSIHLVGFNQLLATLQGNGHDWDLVILSWTVLTYPDVHDFFSSDGTQNYGHFRDPKMDALNRDVMFGSGDGPLRAVEDYAALREPNLYLPTGTPQVLVRPGIGGVEDFLAPNSMWSPELLTLSGPLACPAETKTADATHS